MATMAEEFTTMESQQSFAKKRLPKSDKLYLEDYIHLLHSRQPLHLTMNQLNQVIRIHGFKKLHHVVKKVLIDAVESLDLVDLPRSTLCESVSAFAAVTVDEAVADLSELNWQECCVTSVETLGSYNGGGGGGQSSLPTGASPDQNLQLAIVQSHAHRTKRMDEIYGVVPEPSRRSMPAMKMVPKRKRSTAIARDSAASTVDSVSLASC